MKCAARAGNTGPNDPQDCDAPFCGCNVAWSECIDMLIECGALPDWRPIETAPKTSGSILVYCEERKNTYVVTWHNEGYGYTAAGWYIFGGNGGFLYECPSHWMPRPKPPVTVLDGEGNV